MAPNAYLVYKSDTSRLIYWIIQTSNQIINISKHLTDKDAPKANTTGEVTVATMVALCKFIARHNITNTPPAILRLFRSVIDGRSAVHALFEQIWAWTRDPEIKKSNDSHLHFINALTESFDALGGKGWVDEGDADDCVADEDVEAKHQLDLLVPNNRFGALDMEGNEEADEDDNDEEDRDGVPQPASSAGSKRRPQPKSKKGKARKPHTAAELPLDSYGIVQDEEGQTHEFLFAAYAVAKDCAALRHLLQGVWREAAYHQWNVAAAGAMAKLGVAMVQRTCSAMFVDFPDRDHYGAVIDALVGGNANQPKSGLTLSEGLQRLVSRDYRVVGEETTAADVTEGLMLHTYKDLVEFVQDFRKTRSGKPTKRLLAQVRNWDPDFDLQSASKEQRIQWRREYTINFLYDLVNLFSSGAARRLESQRL